MYKKYKVDDIWQMNTNYNDHNKVKYIKYLHNNQYKHLLNGNGARDDFLTKSEFFSMKLKLE